MFRFPTLKTLQILLDVIMFSSSKYVTVAISFFDNYYSLSVVKVSFYRNGKRWGPICEFKTGGGLLLGMANSEGELTGDDIIYAYPDYYTLLVGKFKSSVMISAKLSYAKSMVFDDITGIPILQTTQTMDGGESFIFDQSNEEDISTNPLLEGMSIKN